jgi:predicted permease
MGRVFTPSEDPDGNPAKVAVLSHRFWQRRFAGSSSAIGETMIVDNEKITVIGVMPKDFDFANNDTAYWGPMGFLPQQLTSAASFLVVAARLNDGARIEQASAEMEGLAAGLRRSDPERYKETAVFVEPIRDAFTQGLKEPLMVLQGAVIFVLLISCSNVAGLLLARAASRRGEVSVRAALGARRGRVIRQLLTESVLLAAAGGVLGCGLGWAGLKMVLASLPEGSLPTENISVSLTVLAFTAGVSILTGLIFGVLPALQTSKVDLATSLRESGRSGLEASARQRLRQVLVAAQIALALVLLIGAGLMMNTFLKLRSNQLGADTSNLLSFEFRFGQSEMMKPVGRFRNFGLWEINPITSLTYDRLHERIKAIPGVLSAAGISRPPLTGTMVMGFTIQGRSPAAAGTEAALSAPYYAVTPGYFGTMKIPVLQGRDFTAQDSAGAPLVVVINKAMAERWWPDENPIGKIITLDFVPNEVPRQIVGVVGNTLQGRFQQQTQPTMYVPHIQQTAQWEGPFWNMRAAMFFVMRTAGDPNKLIPAVRTAVAEIDSGKPAGSIRTVEGYLDDGLSEVRVFMMLLTVFGISAAILAALGIYGVMAYTVAQRTREIGIRVALGASSGNVIGLVVRQAILLILIGIAGGIGGAYALTRFLTNFLWQVKPTDPLTFLTVSLGLLMIAIAACLVPTRRAVAVEPTEALRHE